MELECFWKQRVSERVDKDVKCAKSHKEEGSRVSGRLEQRYPLLANKNCGRGRARVPLFRHDMG
eukprot:31339-Hanusia_phi.AAC.1